MKKTFYRFHRFLLCFLEDDCEYSIKKLLAFVFSALALYIAIWTTKTEIFIETLGIIVALLGIRAWERTKLQQKAKEPNEIG